mgnify:CR=1 FL=1
MPRVFVRQWRNDSAVSSYPFASTLVAVSNTNIPFPVAAILDASFYAVSTPIGITKVTVSEEGTAVISVGTPDETELATAEIAIGDTAEEIELDLHGIAHPTKDIDVVPTFFIVSARRIIINTQRFIDGRTCARALVAFGRANRPFNLA